MKLLHWISALCAMVVASCSGCDPQVAGGTTSETECITLAITKGGKPVASSRVYVQALVFDSTGTKVQILDSAISDSLGRAQLDTSLLQIKQGYLQIVVQDSTGHFGVVKGAWLGSGTSPIDTVHPLEILPLRILEGQFIGQSQNIQALGVGTKASVKGQSYSLRIPQGSFYLSFDNKYVMPLRVLGQDSILHAPVAQLSSANLSQLSVGQFAWISPDHLVLADLTRSERDWSAVQYDRSLLGMAQNDTLVVNSSNFKLVHIVVMADKNLRQFHGDSLKPRLSRSIELASSLLSIEAPSSKPWKIVLDSIVPAEGAPQVLVSNQIWILLSSNSVRTMTDFQSWSQLLSDYTPQIQASGANFEIDAQVSLSMARQVALLHGMYPRFAESADAVPLGMGSVQRKAELGLDEFGNALAWSSLSRSLYARQIAVGQTGKDLLRFYRPDSISIDVSGASSSLSLELYVPNAQGIVQSTAVLQYNSSNGHFSIKNPFAKDGLRDSVDHLQAVVLIRDGAKSAYLWLGFGAIADSVLASKYNPHFSLSLP